LIAEQEYTQKKTFTCWINSQLAKHNPPSVITDLFTDIKKGQVLLDLLEVLSGQQLAREKGSNTFQCRSNIEHALTFLKKQSIKLINIHVTDIAEGNPSIILGLIWTIILHFHIEEVAWTLSCNYNQPSLDCVSVVDLSPASGPPPKKRSKAQARWKMSAKKALLLWAQEQCAMHGSVNVTDFKSSWRNGMAFLAVIHAVRPDLIDMDSVKDRSSKDNLKEAFRIAELELNIPRLLDPEDVDVINPDEKSIMTYVAQFLQYSKDLPVAGDEVREKVKDATVWLISQEEKLHKLQMESEKETYFKKSQVTFVESFNEEKKAFLDVLSLKRNVVGLVDDQSRLRQAWDKLTNQINEWTAKLDQILPPPLDQIEVWLQEIEHLIAEDLPDSQNYNQTMALIKERISSFKSLMDEFDRHLSSLLKFENKDEQHMPMVPPDKLEEMRRRFHNIMGTNFIGLLEFHYYLCSVLGLIEEVKSKLNLWNIKYGTRESVELLLGDWHKFIEEKEFLIQLESSFKTCETMIKNLAGDPQNISKQFKMVESQISMCKKCMYNIKTTLQKVLSSWTTYTENLHSLKTWLEESRKEHPKQVPFETLASWNSVLTTINEVGKFLIDVSNQQVGSSINKELKRLNKRWAKFIKKTQFNLIARGSKYQELVTRKENALEIIAKNILSQVQLQHFHTSGLQTQIKEAKDKVQVSNIVHFLTILSLTSLEIDVRAKFEKSQKELESDITKAQQLLRSKGNPGNLVSQKKDILAILNSKNLDKFLKTAEQLKNIVPPDEKLSLEQISRELSKEWEVLHQEICLYIYRIKIEIEKRLTENISKLEKQLNKEKKLLSKGKTKGLIEEHEACFFDEGSLCQLDLHMEALRELSEELTSEESRQEIRKTIIDYGQRQNEIKNAASEIYMMLKAVNENTQITSENGGRDAGKMVQPSEPNDRDNLELQLQSNKVRVLSEFPSEKERSISCLKDKLTDLQVLKNETDSCWTEFEITSSNLEKIVKDPERSTLSQTREKLKRKEEELQVILSKRMKSLEAALRIVLPVEKEAFLLVDSEQFLHKINIQEFNLAGVDDVYQNLKDIQRCIVKQIELCNNLEPSGSSALNEFNWIDLDAIQSIIVKYRAQFEEMNIKMQNSEMAIKALEDFLALLRKVKLSLQSTTDFSTSDIPEMQENSWTIEDVQKKISLMKEEAKCLDQRMKMLDISLKDAEQGEDTCCEKLVEVFSKMIDETHGHNEHEDFTEQVQLQEVFVAKNTDVLKNIKYIQDQINKIGLKDPTIPAVKQRIKSLTKLEKDLDYYAEEINYLKKMASSLPELKDGKGETPSQQCQETTCLWEDVKSSLEECLEQCQRAMDLLKQYHNCKSILTSLIHKEESVISLQASYMGKENLKRRIAKIEVVREEFNEHSEDVEKINQICKNLQFQLNKMITFEEPPFEKEANVIVDRWLDINEKTENYYDNLVRALALWDKLLNLTSIIDEWIEKVLRKVEVHKLNDAERTQVQEELKIQEQNSAKFGARLVEIEEFLQISEPPLELQVIKSSLLNRIEQIKMHLMDKSTLSEVNGSTAELKEDLDQAKTQIGMTESLLKALSPSDSLEIFTKLEEIQQQILQQKHNMILLENQIGCLTPELSELKKQYESINDLFSTKKRTLQDHFSNLLNDQCKKFDDWFSNIQLTLKECFESPETKKCMEEKLQKLNDSLTFEGKTKDIQEVQTALNNVKRHLPKASVKRLSNWIVARELELQKMKFSCQMQAKQLHDCLQQLLRLQEDYINLSKWLMNQEEKWKEIGVEKEPDFFCQALTRKRQLFESLAELNNSLKKFGLTREEIVIESTNLIEKYETFLTQVCEKGNHQSPAAVDQSFEDLVHDVFSWIMGIKESLMVLNSTEGKMPLEERIQKIKEIILLKPEGDMKIQNIMSLGETGKASLVQDTLSDIKNQWDHTIHLANTYLSHQEKIQLEGEKYLQSKDDLRLMLTELKKKQESGFALQNGLQGKKAQLKIYKKFLQKAEDLTSLLNELKTQGNYLLECTKNPKFSEEKWLEIKHLHESLLHQLQDSVSKLEGHVQEHQLYQDLVADLNTTLENFYQKFLGFPDNLVDEKAAEEKMLTLQELEALLNLKGDTLEKILVLAESIKQNSSSVGQKTIKDETDSLKYKYKNLENRLESVKEETENSFNSILKSKSEIKKKEETAMKKREEQVSSDTQDSIHESITVEKLKERGEVKKVNIYDFTFHNKEIIKNCFSFVFKNSSLEMLLSKQLSPEAQESMKNIEDEQRVNELQNQPLDLDIISANEQLKEIEVLYRQLEAKKANIGSQEPIMLPHNTETSALNVKNIQHSENQLDRLLQALVTLKEDKERQYCLIKDFQDHLLAIKSSVKALSMEKENTKAASMESKQQLKKLEKCLESIHKEKDSLSKLKEEQENLSSHLSEMDKKLAEKQVKQLELCWEQVEQWIQKKYSQQGAEWDEFQCLMNKIQDMENSLQDHQQQQQLKLNSPPELEEHKDLMFLATKLNIIKNNFSLLRGRVEHQMKRIWGKKEKKKLETAISNLQEQLEELEPLTKEKYSQMKNCKIMKKIQEAMLWVNNLLIGLDQTAALLPDNIVSQIKKHKMVHNEVLDKQPIIESLIEETKGVIPDLDQCEATDLNTFLDELQSLNQALVSKCTEIAEQLETRLEERSTFFEKLGKVQSSLQGKEVLITPEIKTASSKEDLDQYLVTLNDTQKELQNTDRLISTHFQEATDFSKCLNIFEQIFLIDQLRNLKNKARWTQRLMQNKHHEVRKKLDIYTEFFEKTDMLQQELSQIRNHALLLNRKPNHGTKEEICELRERTSVLQSNIIQIMKHKDIFESLGLNWDSSHLDKVQAELLKIITELEEKTEQLERVNIENVKLQTSLNELQMVTLQIKKELAEIVNDTSFSPESRLLSAQILSQRIEKATYLCQETIDLLSANETNKESFKQEIPQIRLLAEENNKLHKFLQNVVENFQPRSVGEKDFRDQLECALLVLTEVNFQLQQPLEVGLEIKHIQEEKDNCEALQKRVKAELCQIKAITVKEYPRQEDNSHETRDLESKVNELEDLQLQFDKGFALRMNILDEALENMKHFNKAVTRAVGLINSFKTKVNSHKIDLDNLGESQQLTDWKQEEFKALIVDLKNLTSKLENITGPKDKVQLEHVLCEIINSYSLIKESAETKKSYEGFNKTKQKICAILNKVEGGLQQSISQEAMSYREALERLEQSKNFVSDLVSTQEELTKLRQDFRCLRFMCTENDSICLLKTVSALWERWLSLFENAREWEMFCEELKQDWKFVSEEIEREAIILDNLQEEFPESTKPKEAATNKELSEALECFCQYEENLEREQLLFTLLLHRIKNILSVPESLEITESVPVLQEIRSMQDRCTKLSQKVQGNKELIQLEIEERNNISKEIMSLKNSLEKMTATFRDMPLEEHPEKEDHMEALQKIIDKEKLALENIMEKLRIKYSEMYTIVPAEIECQMEECKKALEDIDEKIRNEVLKSSPSYMMREKIEEINHGLQNVEKMLQQKSKNIEQAQEIQKKMWDELDLWHCKLNELDSEVQDIVEQDPGQAQEWMDNLMVPFQQYQQVSQRAEHRTSQLNKAILKMEEYNDFLRNTETWIENTSSLLAGPTDYSSSKALSHHANTLQMALEDSEQKQNLLHLVYSDLEEFSAIFETDDFAPIKLNQLSARVTNLQQKIIASLPQIQHMADEVIAIENEVKSIEKKVSKIKAILFSKEIFDFSPEEHLKHGEVILDNIKPMKKAIAEIESYQVVLRLPETGMKSLPVFERTNQLLQDVKMLEKATHEKNEILKLVMKQTGECDQEIEKLKYLLKNYSTELSPENFSPDQATTLPHVQREIDSIKEQILNLNQKKEDLLMGLKTTVLALHQRLQQEKQELEKETEESGLAERDVSEWKVCMTSVAITDQKVYTIAKFFRNKEEDRASSSSGTLIQVLITYIAFLAFCSLLLLIYPLNLLQGDTPSIGVPFQSSGEEQGSLEEIVASSRPESVEILHVCQKQVAELELWLDKANLSFRAETLNPEMQQMVEQELAGCQAMLTEIEHKAEMLSLKLKAVKYNLEKVQVMLQDKYSDEKRSNNLKKPSEDQKIQQSDRSPLFEPIVFESPMFGRQKGFQQKVLELNPEEQKDLIKFIEIHAEKMWHQKDQRDDNKTQESVVRSPTVEELKTYTSQLEDLSQEANVFHTQENPTSEPSLNLDKKIFDLLLSISQCLSNMEGMLQTSGLSREDAAIQQVHYEMLSLELQKLHSSITNKKEDLLKLISHSGKNSSVFFECFKNLQTRLEETRTAAASRSQSMKSGIDHNSDYQKADSYAVKLQDYEVQVAKLRDEGERLYLPYVLIQEVYKLEDILDDMWGLLRAKHAELNSPFISESQQEGLLRGLVELLTIGKEKLGQDQRQQIKSKCSLQAQLQNHKGFFQKLVADVFLIQAYSKKALPPLLQNKEKFWTDMVKEVKLLEQHACQYGMKLENLLQKWKEFDENYESLEKDLEILGSSLPSTSLVEETEERLMERISFYQQIKRNIDEKHTKLYQTTNEGKHLTTAVNCPELDSQISKLEEQWLALNKKVDHELHRLQTLLKHLVRYAFVKIHCYNKDSDELTRWLESAQQTLNYWKEQSLNVSQDLDTIRSNINNFFEFSKEVDEKSSLKTSVISTGNQLLHLKEADTATLRSSLAQFEQKWATLITQLPDIQEKLHQLQMEKLPSRQAITEMINWMDSIEQQIADEATLDSQSSVSQVKNLLQKYKESRMEMNYKQWIVDFVNQSLLQLSTSDVESKRYERTEFAERLGEMNRQWHKLHGTLNRKIQHLEQLLESITESENKIQTLRSWMEAQGERLKALQKPGSVISVRRTLLDCQDLENHLTTKSRALDDLKQNYMALESGPMPVLQDTISGINDLYQMRNNIVNQVNQLKTSMQSVLHQEKGYDKLFEEVNMMTIRFWYCVEHSKPDVYSLEALRCQVKNLQFLQDEAESSEGNWSELQDAINKLKDYCPSVTEIIKQKWTQVNHEVAEQLQSAQSMLQLWESYTVAHTEATAKLDQLEEKLKHILTINMSGDNLTEILIQALKDAENLQNELQNIKETFLQNSAVIEPNLEQAGPVKQDVLSNQSSSLQRISYLEKMLLMKSNEFENHMLELTALSPDMEHLNEVSFKLPLSDIDIKTLQNLNRKWSQAAATALEKCSELQGTGSNEKFLHKCENWIQFLEKIEKCLKMNLAGRLEDLLEQQKTFEMLQAEISVNQPIADYFVTQSLQLLDTPEIEKRTEFVMKLTMLKEQWQDATQRAQQRKNTINERVKEWQRFNASLQNVIHFLTDTDHFLSNKEVLLQRQQTTCTLILEAGRKLLMIADPETKDSIDRKTRELQDTWKNSQFQVAEITKQFQSTIETWDRCEKQIKELESKLHTLKAKIKDPLPEPYEELYKEKELIKVSLRKQEIEERLNSWIVFNEKNKDLCAWLVQMENKVLQTADISIEEMIERLQKVKIIETISLQYYYKLLFWCLCQDCMEEINLFSENKLHLKQMGDQLIKASNKTRVAEIDDKLSKINDRWQHLFDVIGSRSHLQVKKLKETFAFIQQLDKNMSNLRSWLARIESELSKPVVYDICDDQEIQKRLAEQQDLQRDIEQHSAGVESVFNICDVLLHDSDACANETECDSIQQTTRSLDRRWRNICAMSMERRMKIEETWRLWQKFLDDYSRFEDWLKSAEKTAAHPNSSEVLYTNAKEELKKFEIHERLTQLELINKQYRRLARENRTDTASKLKQMVHEGNQRWDNLQKRVTAILRRLKHFTNQREEFEGTRESILVWLTEMDLQLTNVEHFSESDVDDKMRQLHGFQQEITLNTNKIDQLIVFGEQLIQKSEPMDAVLIEDELEELHRYCQEGLEDEKEASENETDVEDSREIQTDSWHKKEVNEGPSSPQSLCHLMPPPLGHERSGCETPVSVDSIPLEWDHTGDVGGSSSHEDDEEGPYYSAVSGKSISEAHSWHTPDSPTHPKHHYKQTEVERNVLPITPETSTPYKPEYVSLFFASIALDSGYWKLIQAQDLRNKLRTKHNLQQWQQLDSDINDVTLWLKGTEAELEDLEMAKPAADIQETELRVKKLKDILKAFDNYKALVVSINLSSKKFQQPDNTESKELQNRLRQLNLLWEKANHLLDSWRESLQHSLMQCQDFHQLSQSLLLWLASAENRRCTVQAQVMDSNADPHTILECQKELMQLEKELLEHQHQVSSLQEISKYLLAKGDEDNYIEADEKVHVIGKKLNQLLDQVAQDLESLQDSQDVDTSLLSFDEVDSGGHHLSSTSMSAAGEKVKKTFSLIREFALLENVTLMTEPQDSLRHLHKFHEMSSPATPIIFPSLTASGLHDPLFRGRLQLYPSQQFCSIILSYAEVHQWAPTNIEGSSIQPPTKTHTHPFLPNESPFWCQP
uniref:Spectrin repeat containing nuclear envelope protein 2 n=1 Tax=Monodelphis domestica TaxID=13616 RepID=K7E389_MONDO